MASIDIDAALVETARQRLALLGYHPHLVAGNGADGIPTRAPFDRIIATCAVPAIPAAWVVQLRERGMIVADVRSELASALVVLTKIDAKTAQGRFLAVPGYFMWLRALAGNPLRDGGEMNATTDLANAPTSAIEVDPAILDDPEFRFLLTVSIPDLETSWTIDRDGQQVHVLRLRDGSWAEIDQQTDQSGRYAILQGGPRQIWDQVNTTIKVWQGYGSPALSRFGMTASADGTQVVWLDTPNRVVNTVKHPHSSG